MGNHRHENNYYFLDVGDLTAIFGRPLPAVLRVSSYGWASLHFWGVLPAILSSSHCYYPYLNSKLLAVLQLPQIIIASALIPPRTFVIRIPEAKL
ncbi:hypothetical protein L207DRAFT_512463, partial [Hyaloscypha variabilis F]